MAATIAVTMGVVTDARFPNFKVRGLLVSVKGYRHSSFYVCSAVTAVYPVDYNAGVFVRELNSIEDLERAHAHN